MGTLENDGRSNDNPIIFECDECGMKWHKAHFEFNPYVKLRDGGPCPERYIFNICHGVVRRVATATQMEIEYGG